MESISNFIPQILHLYYTALKNSIQRNKGVYFYYQHEKEVESDNKLIWEAS